MDHQLWNLDGFARLMEIDKLKWIDIDFICSFYGDCNRCPLGLLDDSERVLCVDATPRKEIEAALEQGAHFVTKK